MCQDVICRTSSINHFVTVCSYYEGQLTSISEIDVEDEGKTPRVRVTEAAEKVCYHWKSLIELVELVVFIEVSEG